MNYNFIFNCIKGNSDMFWNALDGDWTSWTQYQVLNPCQRTYHVMDDTYKKRQCTWVLGGVQRCKPILGWQDGIAVNVTPCPGMGLNFFSTS